ncbi:hypothetical protein ACS0TY_027754 [Phlomoides rotata]
MAEECQGQSVQAKKSKAEDESTMQSPDLNLLRVVISDALAKYFGTGEREMLQLEPLGQLWEYIKVNQLEVSGHDMYGLSNPELLEIWSLLLTNVWYW